MFLCLLYSSDKCFLFYQTVQFIIIIFVVVLIQFHDKMDPLLENLEGAVQRLRQPPPVAAEVEKIREQLAEHRAAGLELDKLLPSFSALCARGEELITRAAHDDPAAQGEFSMTAHSHDVDFICVYIS